MLIKLIIQLICAEELSSKEYLSTRAQVANPRTARALEAAEKYSSSSKCPFFSRVLNKTYVNYRYLVWAWTQLSDAHNNKNFLSYEYIIMLSTILLLFSFANKRRCIQLHVLQSCDFIYIAMSPWLKFVQTTWFYILFYGSVIFLNRIVITNLKVSYSRNVWKYSSSDGNYLCIIIILLLFLVKAYTDRGVSPKGRVDSVLQ